MINAPLPHRPGHPGKPARNQDYENQGWNAAQAGYGEKDCPYYASSTAEKYWLRGLRSA